MRIKFKCSLYRILMLFIGWCFVKIFRRKKNKSHKKTNSQSQDAQLMQTNKKRYLRYALHGLTEIIIIIHHRQLKKNIKIWKKQKHQFTENKTWHLFPIAGVRRWILWAFFLFPVAVLDHIRCGGWASHPINIWHFYCRQQANSRSRGLALRNATTTQLLRMECVRLREYPISPMAIRRRSLSWHDAGK